MLARTIALEVLAALRWVRSDGLEVFGLGAKLRIVNDDDPEVLAAISAAKTDHNSP